MTEPSKPGCTVFIGNIDFDIDEETIIKELSAVGKVKSFRLLYDKATGKSKGYGFCEYETPEVADMALKKLKISFNGRQAKINYAENDLPAKALEETSEIKKELVVEQIVKALDTGTNTIDILNYLKTLAVEQPTYLKDLLSENPNLICATMQLLCSIPNIKNDVIKLLESSFDIQGNKQQIEQRMLMMTQKEMEQYPEDIKQRLQKLKFMIQRNQ